MARCVFWFRLLLFNSQVLSSQGPRTREPGQCCRSHGMALKTSGLLRNFLGRADHAGGCQDPSRCPRALHTWVYLPPALEGTSGCLVQPHTVYVYSLSRAKRCGVWDQEQTAWDQISAPHLSVSRGEGWAAPAEPASAVSADVSSSSGHALMSFLHCAHLWGICFEPSTSSSKGVAVNRG